MRRAMRCTKIGKDGKPIIGEKLFQEWVRRAAIVAGWRFYHTHNSFRSAAGFPDCVLVKDGRLIFAELKAEGKQATDEQQAWLDALKDCVGVGVYLWRPGDMDEIWRVLKEG